MKALSRVEVIELKKHMDNRGSFIETYVQEEAGSPGYGSPTFYFQDNQSISKKNVIRGLHFQKKHPQSKLVRVVKGSILDVCVDINENSPDFLNYFSIKLSDKNNLCVSIPGTYAHGFLSLEEDTIVSYKCNDYYHPEYQGGIIWNDKDIGIDWGINENNVILSEKDNTLPTVKEMFKR